MKHTINPDYRSYLLLNNRDSDWSFSSSVTRLHMQLFCICGHIHTVGHYWMPKSESVISSKKHPYLCYHTQCRIHPLEKKNLTAIYSTELIWNREYNLCTKPLRSVWNQLLHKDLAVICSVSRYPSILTRSSARQNCLCIWPRWPSLMVGGEKWKEDHSSFTFHQKSSFRFWSGSGWLKDLLSTGWHGFTVCTQPVAFVKETLNDWCCCLVNTDARE